ncbi:uncharacterized protein LOC121743729 isoform X1 [Salvia splendens]|uniref:uncharacterized protein LOC121743729 isoform X1 n=1 Tax=Salvia splendens TaxID=180675 RepID=UPI001C278776|nr:uncharacterized protein LOC121743729 isoform X1 [Salvia splendens]XP_041993013.1 uncharacterized protein LOC121743729 isoform X1 [Salvia splendens]
MNERMLQRQMFKQLQEMQRRQQLQELTNARNQNYVNQLSSVKQSSSGQFSPTVNGTPMQDPSGMFMTGNMMQHSGSNGLVLGRSPAGLSQPQLDLSLYGNHTPNPDKNLNQYAHLQGPSNLSTNSSPLGMVSMQPSGFRNSFMSQHFNFPADQINMTDVSVHHSNQEKDLFGQAPTEGLHSAGLSGSYSEQGTRMQGHASALECEGRHEDPGWGGLPAGTTSNFGMSVVDDSLDPLEQKILYNTDDDSWGSFRRSSKVSTGGFAGMMENMSDLDGSPSIQSGSWSALMQSALEETSGNDPGVQEELSGLSSQNPEPLNDNQLPKSNDSKRLQNNWVNRNSPNAVSPRSKPQQMAQNFNMNSSFANFQQSGYEYQKQKEEYYSEFSHATAQNSPRSTSMLPDYNTPQKLPSGRTPVIHTSLPLPNMWPGQHKENPNNDAREAILLSCPSDNQLHNDFSGQESKGAFWLQGSTSHHVPGGFQKKHDQVNQVNTHGYSVHPEIMTSGVNMEAASSVLNVHLERPGENMTAPRSSDPQTSQTHSVFPSLSMAASSSTTLSSHIVNDHVENQHQPSPVPSRMNAEVPLSGNVAVAQPSLTSDRLQHAGFQMGQHTQWQGMALQQDTSSPGSYIFSSSLFGSPDSASNTTRASSAATNGPHYLNYSQQIYNAKQYSGNLAGLDQRLEKGSSIHEGSTDINSSTSLSSNIQKQEHFRDHGLDAGSIGSGSLMTDDGKSFPPKPDSVNYQHPNANLEELFLSGQDSGNKGVAKTDLSGVSFLDTYSSGDSKGWKPAQGGQDGKSDKTLLISYQQNFQQSMLSQNDIPPYSVGSKRPSNAVHPSRISLPMVQSWFKQPETLKNGQRLPIYDSRAAIQATQLSSEMTHGTLQDNSLNMQVNLADASQGNGLLSPPSRNPVLHKQLNPASMLPSSASHQNLAVTLQKKRKLVAFNMVPWHKEINNDQLWPQDISTAEFSWAQAANRREEEVISEAEIVEELHPVIQAKRRLICCTQLMQQVFRPAPSIIICMDSSSNCDYLAYYAARLTLGDACSLTGQFPPDSMDESDSHDKPETSGKTGACKFSKVVEDIVCRTKKLEGDLMRLEKSLSIVDIKVEAQELEKFSTINRFAKFHIRAQPSSVGSETSSSASALHKTPPQRYVAGHPMPNIVPESVDCLCL